LFDSLLCVPDIVAVAIKFAVQGIEYTADTPSEAVELQKLLSRQVSAQKAAVTRWKAPSGKPKAAVAKRSKTPPNRLFLALFDAGPGAHMTGAQIAQATGVGATSIAPLFAHAYKWQRKVAAGESFDTFVKKDINAAGDTIFMLTDEGRSLVERVRQG
jgi:hypothetical protein